VDVMQALRFMQYLPRQSQVVDIDSWTERDWNRLVLCIEADRRRLSRVVEATGVNEHEATLALCDAEGDEAKAIAALRSVWDVERCTGSRRCVCKLDRLSTWWAWGMTHWPMSAWITQKQDVRFVICQEWYLVSQQVFRTLGPGTTWLCDGCNAPTAAADRGCAATGSDTAEP